MDTGLAREMECGEVEIDKILEEKEKQLLQLNLRYQNYLAEEAALTAKLDVNPDDIVRAIRLKLLKKRLMPTVCDLILQHEISMS